MNVRCVLNGVKSFTTARPWPLRETEGVTAENAPLNYLGEGNGLFFDGKTFFRKK